MNTLKTFVFLGIILRTVYSDGVHGKQSQSELKRNSVSRNGRNDGAVSALPLYGSPIFAPIVGAEENDGFLPLENSINSSKDKNTNITTKESSSNKNSELPGSSLNKKQENNKENKPGNNSIDKSKGGNGVSENNKDSLNEDSILALTKSIPGTPNVNYPILASVPNSSFTCEKKVDGGYYADSEAQCQVFHICSLNIPNGFSKYSFLCPNGTIFNQRFFICDWWFNVDCSLAKTLYSLNDDVQAERKKIDATKKPSTSNSGFALTNTSKGPSKQNTIALNTTAPSKTNNTNNGEINGIISEAAVADNEESFQAGNGYGVPLSAPEKALPTYSVKRSGRKFKKRNNFES